MRAVTDSLEDSFLAPFSYDPEASALGRAARIAAAGNWVARYSGWRERAAHARATLDAYMQQFFNVLEE